MGTKNKIPAQGKISVGCKLPHGLHLDVAGTRITLKGANDANIVGGHGITDGVDAELFARWVTENSQHPAIVQDLIFAHGNNADAKAQAKEQEKVKTGFEGIDPTNPGNGVQPAEKDE